jgi:hypothetical protein
MTTILDCGHPPSDYKGIGTGYGTAPDGKTACYECCAVRDREQMVRDGTAVLYLTSHRQIPSGNHTREVINWPGSLRFAVTRWRHSRHGGGFGTQRTDAWFIGPDGATWHAINRGDMDVARCKRVKGAGHVPSR